MTIGGFSDYGYMYRPYDVYKIPVADSQKMNQPELENESVQQNAVPQMHAVDVSDAVVPAERTNVALEDVALTFLKDDTFDMIGSESDLNKLDIQKAISDMQKDKILQDYNYFVGSSLFQPGIASEDGIVIPK